MQLLLMQNNWQYGEMVYRKAEDSVAEIGIKICDFSLHDKGLGKILLSMLISSLFNDMGYTKIILDTNIKNKRAQHVYEKLGFRQVRVRENSWKNQLGEWQTVIDYEMYPNNFVDFTKQQ